MDRVDTCRQAACDAISDVEPAALNEFLTDTLEAASMTPGVLTLACASALERASANATANATATATVSETESETESDATAGSSVSRTATPTELNLEAVAHHAAGVQLIYEGLRLTRMLAHEEPWAETTGDGRADLEILAADILVARGFYLLARTDAATTAVRTVRQFGRDQTLRADATTADATALDANLERDVLELAVCTGATAVDAHTSSALLEVASTVAADVGASFPPAGECIPSRSVLEDAVDEYEPERERQQGRKRKRDAEPDLERPPTELTTDRVTSAGDP
ncbi:DUF7114 family protein [Natronosalvus vescus]|uniref:DUF7114 family protein n=1 Tax=Natronosalvus vescus TaxID=2953881 RepID=UPI0020919CB2|nr:hypothetical protein [Natronosalvus vescus]